MNEEEETLELLNEILEFHKEFPSDNLKSRFEHSLLIKRICDSVTSVANTTEYKQKVVNAIDEKERLFESDPSAWGAAYIVGQLDILRFIANIDTMHIVHAAVSAHAEILERIGYKSSKKDEIF